MKTRNPHNKKKRIPTRGHDAGKPTSLVGFYAPDDLLNKIEQARSQPTRRQSRSAWLYAAAVEKLQQAS